jgi:hypothetical protein
MPAILGGCSYVVMGNGRALTTRWAWRGCFSRKPNHSWSPSPIIPRSGGVEHDECAKLTNSTSHRHLRCPTPRVASSAALYAFAIWRDNGASDSLAYVSAHVRRSPKCSLDEFAP